MMTAMGRFALPVSALSVGFTATSPKGRGFLLPKALPLGELPRSG